jgi:hypothetical protein
MLPVPNVSKGHSETTGAITSPVQISPEHKRALRKMRPDKDVGNSSTVLSVLSACMLPPHRNASRQLQQFSFRNSGHQSQRTKGFSRPPTQRKSFEVASLYYYKFDSPYGTKETFHSVVFHDFGGVESSPTPLKSHNGDKEFVL